jgi:RNA polymerase sigma-70 factor, ECF subfamily
LGAVRSSLRQFLPADDGQHPTRFRDLPRGRGRLEAARFDVLYREHAAGVYAAAQRILGRRAEAEDVTQEVFLRLWRDPGRFDPRRGELGSYLRMMARSRALDLWRQEQAAGRARDRLRLLTRGTEARPDERPAASAEREELRRDVRAALGRLPPAQREALVLGYWGSLTADEVARRAGVPFGTARSRMRLGLEKLRRECGPAVSEARADA